MSEYKLKKTKVEEKVVGTYKKIEDGVVNAYKNVEDAVVGTYKKIEDQIKVTVGLGLPTSLNPDDITPRCRRIIESALAVGRTKQGKESGTEQILIALVGENDCAGCRILSNLGVHPHEFYNSALGNKRETENGEKKVSSFHGSTAFLSLL